MACLRGGMKAHLKCALVGIPRAGGIRGGRPEGVQGRGAEAGSRRKSAGGACAVSAGGWGTVVGGVCWWEGLCARACVCVHP